MYDRPVARDGGQRASAAVQAWRERVLNLVLLVGLGAFTVAFLARLREDLSYRDGFTSGVLLPPLGLIVVGLLWRRGPFVVRKALLVLAFQITTVLVATRSGFLLPNMFVATLMVSVWSALFLEARGTWITWASIAAVWTGVAVYAVATGLRPESPALDPSDAANWARVLAIYLTISAGTVSTVRFLVGRLETAMQKSDDLRQALETESAQRITALEDQRRLEVQLEQSQKLEALGTLAGGVAHDFNNLLVVILGNAELIAETSNDDDAKAAAKDIVAAADRATGLTRQLLAFGRQRVKQRAPIDVGESIAESVRLLRRVLPERIALDTELADELPRAWGPPTAVEQIFLNLCVNARDAIHEHGTITVRTCLARRRVPGDDREGDFVQVSVGDDGHGMTEETRRRVFEPFFTTKALGQGTGLGLSVVHGLVEQCGGFIEVESTPGDGTRFDVFFAIHRERIEPCDEQAARVPVGDGETVLVVDDDVAVRDVIVHVLERAGYVTQIAEDGDAGIAAFREHAARIRLIVTDVVMPKRGARAMHDAIVADGADVPFLVVSGYAPETMDQAFFDRPGRAFLSKPFTSAQLLLLVRALIDGRVHAKPSSGSAEVIRSETR